jgi:drug/metabolite transporter (DMT)-like permease
MIRFENQRFAAMAAMLCAAATFAFMDAGLKLLTTWYPPAQVAALRGLSALPIVLAWTMFDGGLAQLWRVRWSLHLVRGVLAVVLLIAFSYGIKELSLAKAYSLFFVAPLLIAILSWAMFGERVRRAQWIAIAVGFCGVLVVLKPGAAGYTWAGTLAILAAALSYSMSSLLVKILGRTDSTQSMVFWMTCMLAIGATVVAIPGWTPFATQHFPIVLGVAVTGALGGWGLTYAFKHAPAASVAPLEYSGLAWVLGIDYVVWDVTPEARMLAGAAVIIASGLFLLRSETIAKGSDPIS